MNSNLSRLLCLLICLGIAPRLLAQKWEAESAALSAGAAKIACASCSGAAAVAQNAGNLRFSISLAEEGLYNVYLMAASPSGNKINIVDINGTSADFVLNQNAQYNKHKLISTYTLAAGPHTIEIKNSWGYINIDYLELEQADAARQFNLNQRLVHPNPIPEAKALFDFLLDNYGDKVISGVMTLDSLDEVLWLKQHIGKEPALLGLDFMHSGRAYTWYDDEEPIKIAQAYYERNGIPALIWHWRDPSRLTEEFYTRNNSKPTGTTFDISKISNPNSAEYKAMLQDIDYVAGMLKKLQEQGVPVIWRPLHEAAGGWFWWGAKGPAPLKTLWHLMYDRMVHHHGLRNLIWVWTREPGDEAWYPGDEYVDLVGRDIYKDGNHSSHAIEFNNLNALYGRRKMITLSEVGSFPDPDQLVQDRAGWSWFMPWYGKYVKKTRVEDLEYNSLELWQKTMNHEYVITLDEMPNLRTYVRQGPVVEPEPDPAPEPQPQPTGLDEFTKLGFNAYPTLVDQELVLEGPERISSIKVYNALGICIRQQLNLNTSKAQIAFAGLSPGIYLVKVNEQVQVKVYKK